MQPPEAEAVSTVPISPRTHALLLEMELPARVTEVMAAWTDPERLTRWWPTTAAFDARSGGSYTFAWPDQGWWLRGHVTELTATSLAFSWRWDHRPELPDRTVRVSVAPGPTAASSVLSLEHGTYDATELDQTDRAHHEAGWRHFLDRLSATLGEPSHPE